MTQHDPALDYRAGIEALKTGEKGVAAAYFERAQATGGYNAALTQAWTRTERTPPSSAWTLQMQGYKLASDTLLNFSGLLLLVLLGLWVHSSVRLRSVGAGLTNVLGRFRMFCVGCAALCLLACSLAAWREWIAIHPLGWTLEAQMLVAGPGAGFSSISRADAGERLRKDAQESDFCRIVSLDRADVRGWLPCTSILLFGSE